MRVGIVVYVLNVFFERIGSIPGSFLLFFVFVSFCSKFANWLYDHIPSLVVVSCA